MFVAPPTFETLLVSYKDQSTGFMIAKDEQHMNVTIPINRLDPTHSLQIKSSAFS